MQLEFEENLNRANVLVKTKIKTVEDVFEKNENDRRKRYTNPQNESKY